MKTLVHELDHAYRDWLSYVNKEEFHLYDFAKPGTRYYKCRQWTNIATKDYTKRMLYYLEEFELSAYLSEIKTDLDEYDYSDYNQLIDLAEKHSEAYQLYNNLLVSFAELVKSKELIIGKHKMTLNEFCNEFNEINDSNLQNKEIIEEITQKLSEIVKFVNKLLLSIYKDKNKIVENDIFKISCIVEKL